MQNLFCAEGNLGSNPTLKYVPVGGDGDPRPVVEFDVRFNYQRKDRQSDEYVDVGGFWARVQQWGKRAEYLAEHLKRGCRVLVVGEYLQEPYVATKGAKQGQEVISNNIIASHVGLVMLGVESVTFVKRNDTGDEPLENESPESAIAE